MRARDKLRGLRQVAEVLHLRQDDAEQAVWRILQARNHLAADRDQRAEAFDEAMRGWSAARSAASLDPQSLGYWSETAVEAGRRLDLADLLLERAETERRAQTEAWRKSTMRSDVCDAQTAKAARALRLRREKDALADLADLTTLGSLGR